MTEKIGFVKNPLSIIAIFAGLAEISATIVLPLLGENIQFYFIWFVMLFPTILVILFFHILWKKHEVFYAPSDYRSDEMFVKIALKQIEKSINAVGDVVQPVEEASIIISKK